jgi:hypothetical protein
MLQLKLDLFGARANLGVRQRFGGSAEEHDTDYS